MTIASDDSTPTSRRRRLGAPTIVGTSAPLPHANAASAAGQTHSRRRHPEPHDAVVLDSLDVEIIRHLSIDGRTPNREIARALHVPEATVRYRVRRLTDMGIMRITATVDPEALGYALTTVISVAVEPRKFSAAAHTIADMPEVIWLAVTTGASDVIFTATFRNQDDLFDFVSNRLAHVDGIDRIETSVCMHVVKKGQRWSTDLTAASVSVLQPSLHHHDNDECPDDLTLSAPGSDAAADDDSSDTLTP